MAVKTPVNDTGQPHVELRQVTAAERASALALVWRVFREFEGPDYTEEGIRSFKAFLDDPLAIAGLDMHAAWEAGRMAGVLATRSAGRHIALLFVDGRFQGRGIGRQLFETALSKSPDGTLTVNSSPYALGFYQHLGFSAADSECLADGIRYTPMRYPG
ncbi:MAG: GNAT family N-acetyltransferase [Anaerolineae bacterium]